MFNVEEKRASGRKKKERKKERKKSVRKKEKRALINIYAVLHTAF